MAPVSTDYVSPVIGERERRFTPQAEMLRLSAEVKARQTCVIPGQMWLDTGYYANDIDTRLVTSKLGIVVPTDGIDINKVVPPTVFWLQSFAADYESFGGVKLEFDLDKLAVLLTPKGEKDPFRLDPGIEYQTYPRDPVISDHTARTILALMCIDPEKLGQDIYVKIEKEGLVMVNLTQHENVPFNTIVGFASMGKSLKQLGVNKNGGVPFENDVLYSFDRTLSGTLLRLNQLKSFHPIVVLTVSDPQFLQGFPELSSVTPQP